MSEVFILEGARTPFAAWSSGSRGDGQKGGALRKLDPFDLGAAALKGALARAGLPSTKLDRIVFGNMYHVGAHACYGARYVGWRAGLPPEIPGITVALACGTGLQALITGAEIIASRQADFVAAIGADSPSLVRRDVFVPSFTDISCGKPIAAVAQEMAAEKGFSRQEQDAWALRSHETAARARTNGLFTEEIVPVGGISQDDAILEKPGAQFFTQSKPLHEGGTVTAANTHAVVDGGSALILSSQKTAVGKPLGWYLSGIVIGLKPERMAAASIAAIRKLLDSLRLAPKDIDLFEINETLAAQVLIDIKELGLPPEKVNVNGGALALGHSFAGTGCRLVLTLLKELKRRGLKRGIASICIGGGLGVAVAVEAL